MGLCAQIGKECRETQTNCQSGLCMALCILQQISTTINHKHTYYLIQSYFLISFRNSLKFSLQDLILSKCSMVLFANNEQKILIVIKNK